MSITKTVIPNKEWLIKDEQTKIGSIAKTKKGYVFLKRGEQIPIADLTAVKLQFGITAFEDGSKVNRGDDIESKHHAIYDFPCKSKPYDPVYSIKEKLPLYAKSDKSKSQYCAGHYTIRFRKGWVKSFCPKLITLKRYPYQGPYKTDAEVRVILTSLNKQ